MLKAQLPIGTIIALLLVVAFIAIMAFIFLKFSSGANPLSDLLSLFNTGSTPNAPDAAVLESAIQCSFYRCTEGCASDNVKKLKNPTGGAPFDCSSFCNASWTDTGKSDGKICGDNSKNHPVTADVLQTTFNGEKLSLSNVSFSPCIGESTSCGSPASGRPKFIYVEINSVASNTETKKSCMYSSGFQSLIVTSGTYNIWTTSKSFLGDTGQATYVCGV